MSKSRIFIICASCILLFSVMLRIGYFSDAIQRPDYTYPQHDAEFKDYWARALVTQNWDIPDGKRDPFELWPYPTYPGYPWFLAANYFLFGIEPAVIIVIQSILGAFTVLLSLIFVNMIWGRAAALATGVLLSVYWILPFTESVLDQAALVNFLAVCFFIALLKWLRTISNNDSKQASLIYTRKAALWLFVAGLLIVYIFSNRLEMLPFTVFLILWVLANALISIGIKHSNLE